MYNRRVERSKHDLSTRQQHFRHFQTDVCSLSAELLFLFLRALETYVTSHVITLRRYQSKTTNVYNNNGNTYAYYTYTSYVCLLKNILSQNSFTFYFHYVIII
uniref:Uncharacterized protein n=1 Tax=Sipha flava TaxID=143950 RepID=A0A2S2QC31_9HEMI